jgi:NADPH:quinone reductase
MAIVQQRTLWHNGVVRAARANRYGGPDVLAIEEIDRAPLEEGAVRVGVDAAAVNFPDLLMLANRYQVTIPLPYTPGAEFSGTVLEVGPLVTGLSPGMAVIGMATHGSFAEEVVIEAGRLTPIPASIHRHAAAAFGVTYFTAYHALRTMARVDTGEWVVVLGATGGVGLAAVDIAGALGARVFGAASTEERCAFLKQRGVEGVCNYSTEDLKDSIKKVTGGGAQVTIDPVGGAYSEAALRALAWGGRFVVIGFASGEIARIPLNLVLLKGVVLTGFENRTIPEHLPGVVPQHRREVLDLLVEGRVAPHVHAVYPLEDVARALEDVQARRVIGKVVIDVSGRQS